jgi:hypothetical protein
VYLGRAATNEPFTFLAADSAQLHHEPVENTYTGAPTGAARLVVVRFRVYAPGCVAGKITGSLPQGAEAVRREQPLHRALLLRVHRRLRLVLLVRQVSELLDQDSSELVAPVRILKKLPCLGVAV